MQIGSGDRRTLLDRKRKGKRPATGGWGREETYWERVLKMLALLWSSLTVKVIFDLNRAWAVGNRHNGPMSGRCDADVEYQTLL